MKKLNLLALAFSALALVSCSNEEGNPEPELKNQANYKEQKINLASAVYPNEAWFSPYPIGSFYFSNGNLLKEEVNQNLYDGDFGIYLFLGHVDGSSIDDGTYITIPTGPFDTEGKGRVSQLSLVIDSNNDEKTSNNDTYIKATEGEVILKNIDEGIYEFTFEVTLENGEKLTGYYKGQVLSSSQLPSNN